MSIYTPGNLIRRNAHGVHISVRSVVGRGEKLCAPRAAETERRSPTRSRPAVPDRYRVRPTHRHGLEHDPRRTRMWQRSHMLAQIPRVVGVGNLGGGQAKNLKCPGTVRANRHVPCRYRQCVSPCRFWGAHTGPNPTDRGKAGCKRHIITEANGIPLVVQTTPANVYDGTPMIELVDRIPFIQGPLGRPRHRPEKFHGDRAYGSRENIAATRARGIQSLLAPMHSKEHGSGLGHFRYVVERTLSWFNNYRRLRLCYEKDGFHFQALHEITACLICANKLEQLGTGF